MQEVGWQIQSSIQMQYRENCLKIGGSGLVIQDLTPLVTSPEGAQHNPYQSFVMCRPYRAEKFFFVFSFPGRSLGWYVMPLRGKNSV